MLWYPIPGFPLYAANTDGQIKNVKTERILQIHWQSDTSRSGGQARERNKQKIKLVHASGKSKTCYAHRLILSAKLGRNLESWEVCRHINGNPADNSMTNLEAGCMVNNMIDELELGRLQTSIEQIDIAISRLQALKQRMSSLEGSVSGSN